MLGTLRLSGVCDGGYRTIQERERGVKRVVIV